MAITKITDSEQAEARDASLIRACEVANQDEHVVEIEKEFDGIEDEIAESRESASSP